MQKQVYHHLPPAYGDQTSIRNRIIGTLRFLLYRLRQFLYRGKMGTGMGFRGVVYG